MSSIWGVGEVPGPLMLGGELPGPLTLGGEVLGAPMSAMGGVPGPPTLGAGGGSRSCNVGWGRFQVP